MVARPSSPSRHEGFPESAISTAGGRAGAVRARQDDRRDPATQTRPPDSNRRFPGAKAPGHSKPPCDHGMVPSIRRGSGSYPSPTKRLLYSSGRPGRRIARSVCCRTRVAPGTPHLHPMRVPIAPPRRIAGRCAQSFASTTSKCSLRGRGGGLADVSRLAEFPAEEAGT